jgi:hypothetical protein
MAVAARASVEIPAASDCTLAVKLRSAYALTSAIDDRSGSATWMAATMPNKTTAE